MKKEVRHYPGLKVGSFEEGLKKRAKLDLYEFINARGALLTTLDANGEVIIREVSGRKAALEFLNSGPGSIGYYAVKVRN